MANSLIELAKAVHANICDDVDSRYILTNEMKHQLVENIIALSDEERLTTIDYLKKLFPLSVSNAGHISSTTVDFLNISQFVKLDVYVRRLLCSNQKV